MDKELEWVVDELEKTRWGAMILDTEYRVCWVSEELKLLIDEHDEEKLGYGKHVVEAWVSDTWMPVITPQSQIESFMTLLPYILWTTPKEKIKEMLGPHLEHAVDDLEPQEPPPVHVTVFEYLSKGFQPTKVRGLTLNLHANDGRRLGHLLIYGSALPARILALVARGDEGMFMRMANLIQPGRRKAAVLFADLQESGPLSRRMPSATYFQLISKLTDAIDRVVIDHTGIVGKHAGDGVTAFFLAEYLGSDSKAAAAAIRSARMIGEVAASVTKEVIDETGMTEASDLCVNVGVHWGGTLYMGQLVTGGRLEITALGDAVNECARIQETAHDGQALGSKNLIEHLDPEDAAALHIDQDNAVYRTLSDLEGASSKAVRDAGTLPVTLL